MAQLTTFIVATVSASTAMSGPCACAASATEGDPAAPSTPASAAAVVYPGAATEVALFAEPEALGRAVLDRGPCVLCGNAEGSGVYRFFRERRVMMDEKTTKATPPRKRPACLRVRAALVVGEVEDVDVGAGIRALAASDAAFDISAMMRNVWEDAMD